MLTTSTLAVESGAVTSVAISADHSTVAAGHTNGTIFTWDIAKPAKPFLHIPSTDSGQLRRSEADGHVSDVAVLHIGFLGTRHTALVSADDKGMAFSHLATRGIGVVTRSVRTTRILGRYPDVTPASVRPRKPSSVLAFAPLPLGNVEFPTDVMGLVAMLTPYLLVVVSTTPVAQTQYKAARPKELAAHGAMSAALAWFPAMKTTNSKSAESEPPSNAKLAYCWSNVLIILDLLETESSEGGERDKPPDLQFRPTKNWKAEEAIVAIQWLGKSVLAVLTITQQLVILEDISMKVTDSSDLIQKHIFHVDLFSQQLNQLVEHLDEEDVSMHGVVADAFYMSFRAYKGRLFLLGFNDLSLGVSSNWADRLLALMEQGNFVGAIQLATSYYDGDTDKVTIGLPSEDQARHALVQEKLVEMMSASLKYAFGKNQEAGISRISESHLLELATACFRACIGMNDMDFLFDEVYAWYLDSQVQGIFLEILEPYIVDGDIKVLPPSVIKDLISHFSARDLDVRLEEMLCHLDPQTMDIDQITNLCKSHRLYDALFYVWNQALDDYTTLLTYLLDLQESQPHNQMNGESESALQVSSGASKIFPYMSYILTSRVYPTGEEMQEAKATVAKAEIYQYLFSGSTNVRSNARLNGTDVKSSFPNLRRLLNFDAPSLLSTLNEAFEDSFLNGSHERGRENEEIKLTERQRSGLSINRQYVVSILLEVMVPPKYGSEDIVYLDMFIARNLPKFPQFILLPGSVLHRVLVELCNYPSDEIADDCQLSVEYLLSVYQPPDLVSLISLFSQAKFYRVLKSIYRTERQYAQLLRTCFDDRENPDALFECIGSCLKPSAGLSEKQKKDVRAVIVEHARELTEAGLTKAASTIDKYAPDLHGIFLDELSNDEHDQYQYLQEIHEPDGGKVQGRIRKNLFVEQYVRLLCDYNPHHVSDFIEQLIVGELRLEEVLPALESSGVIDAAVVLMAREGKVREATDRLIQHLKTLEAALLGLLDGATESPDVANTQEASEDLVQSIQKYARVGVWLCQGQSKSRAPTNISRKSPRRSHSMRNELSMDESLWLDLIDAVVEVTKQTTEVLEAQSGKALNHITQTSASKSLDTAKLITSLRTIVQETFTALLITTSAPQANGSRGTEISFLRILRAFLNRASLSSPSLSNLRAVLGAIFSAYSYEESLLALANRLLDKDLFVHVAEATALRKKGWRPLGQVCEGCGRRIWGPGAGGDIWDAWSRKEQEEADKAVDADISSRSSIAPASTTAGNGKGKAVEDHNTQPPSGSTSMPKEPKLRPGESRQGDLGPLVIFACRHVFHWTCLEEMQDAEDPQVHGLGRPEFSCPLDT